MADQPSQEQLLKCWEMRNATWDIIQRSLIMFKSIEEKKEYEADAIDQMAEIESLGKIIPGY